MSDWKNRSTRFDDKPKGPSYPYIQWINQGGSLEPRSSVGGFFQPAEQADRLGSAIPGTATRFYIRSGKQDEGVYTQNLQIAVICDRFGWENDKTGEFAQGKYPGSGWHGKEQALALVKDAAGAVVGPVLFTFTGWAGSYFVEAWNAHKEAIRSATVTDDAPDGSPAWLFFGTYVAGQIEMVGKEDKSPVTRVVYDPGGFDPDTVYIGDEAADLIEEMAEEIKAWKNAWRNGNGHNAAGDESGGDDKPAIREPNAPASDAQWDLIRKLMAKLGIEGEQKQNASIQKQTGHDPARLTKAQASDVITRLQKANGK